MALHFVTASQNGVKHVQSYNDAHYNAGTLGNGCYILPVRDKLQASMPDSNTVRILGGDFVVCGRHVAIDGGYEEVNIDNGVPGYNRIDLVVARVETAPSEKAELKVYKGEETTGTPVVPGHVEGDLNDGDTVCEMPICSVRVTGINPQAPEMLAKESIDIMALLEELRDYKSQCPHRVGQLYLSFDATSPEKIWPGTKWTKITGYFLRAANDTSTGGSDSVTLTVAQMPKHSHNQNISSPDTSGASMNRDYASWGASRVAQQGCATMDAGEGKPFDNRPAFQNVYAWRRTA